MARTRQEEREYIPQQIRWQIFKDCNETCAHCGKHLVFKQDFTLEHVIPLHKGGKNDISNYVALCKDCNKDKSDDIIEPLEYYQHLPQEKLKSLQALFQEYLTSTDWLSYNTLFKMDRFNLPIHVAMRNGRARVPTLIPSTARVEKMRPEEVIQYLLMYGARLNPYDKQMLAYDEKELNSDFYRVFKGQTLIMVISAYIRKQSLRTDFNPNGNERNLLHLDIFVNPELKIRSEDTYHTMFSIVDALIVEMKSTLANNIEKSGIECFVSTPRSDKLGATLIEWCCRIQGPAVAHPALFAFGNDPEISSAIIGFSTILFQGSTKELKSIMNDAGTNNLMEFVSAGGLENTQSNLNTRLSQSQEKIEPPKSNKKQNPKKKNKKINPKRLKRPN